jgi:MFS family permease
MKNKNIFLVYLISCARYSWFWMGIWVFYYLRFTDYSGIGLLETVLFFTTVLSEIPTGAIADLLGKKNTIIISLFVLSIGQFALASATNLGGMVISSFIIGIGMAFYSGTMDAYLYDYLAQNNQQNNYDKIFSKTQTIQLITLTLCTIIGGYIYSVSPSLPFYLNGLFSLLGAFVSFFLVKLSVDNQIFSLKKFSIQTKQGFSQLFKSIDIRKKIYLLLTIGCIFTISTQSLDNILGIEFGFDTKSLSLLTAAMLLITSVSVQFVPKLRRKYGNTTSLFFVGILAVLIYIVSPFVSLFLGGLTLILRQTSDSFFENLSSNVINNSVPSQFRATSLSTFNMIKQLPYAFGAFFLGALMDNITARYFAFILGILLLILLAANYFNLRTDKNR